MKIETPLHADHRLDQLAGQFELWRQSRSQPRERIPKTLSIRFKDRQSFIKAYSENISPGGLFIRTEKPLKQGEVFFLKLQLPEIADPMEVKCEVAWARKQVEDSANRPSGMGIKFTEISDRDRSNIKEYIKN